jgi:hypothetical protein
MPIGSTLKYGSYATIEYAPLPGRKPTGAILIADPLEVERLEILVRRDSSRAL